MQHPLTKTSIPLGACPASIDDTCNSPWGTGDTPHCPFVKHVVITVAISKTASKCSSALHPMLLGMLLGMQLSSQMSPKIAKFGNSS